MNSVSAMRNSNFHEHTNDTHETTSLTSHHFLGESQQQLGRLRWLCQITISKRRCLLCDNCCCWYEKWENPSLLLSLIFSLIFNQLFSLSFFSCCAMLRVEAKIELRSTLEWIPLKLIFIHLQLPLFHKQLRKATKRRIHHSASAWRN